MSSKLLEDDDNKTVKPFLDHLEDLRMTIFRSLVVLVVSMLIVIPLSPYILKILTIPLKLSGVDLPPLESYSPLTAITLIMRMSFWSGVIISSPFLCWFIADFVFPGLTKTERLVILNSSGGAVFLMIGGVLVGYFAAVPGALRIMFNLHQWLGIEPKWRIMEYVTLVLQLLLAFGLAFELPLFVLILGKIGVINAKQLQEKRKHVIVGLLILAMILTPPDVFTQLIMAIPLIILFELCIWILKAGELKKAKTDST